MKHVYPDGKNLFVMKVSLKKSLTISQFVIDGVIKLVLGNIGTSGLLKFARLKVHYKANHQTTWKLEIKSNNK